MMKCKWAGDAGDEYCKNCDGVAMMVDGKEIPCSECAGYEEGTESVENNTVETNTETEVDMNPPFEETPTEPIKPTKKPAKTAKVTNTTPEPKKPEKTASNVSDKPVKVAEEKKVVEQTTDNISIASLRYTSSCTVKKCDNYYKFSAEEEWDVSKYSGDIQDARDMLWAKLNSEVDRQIDDLSNM